PGLVLQYGDDPGPNGLALDLGIGHAIEAVNESLACIDVDEVHLEGIPEGPDDPLDLAVAQDSVVHEQTRELIADGPVNQGGDYGGIDAAGKRAEHGVLAHLPADALDGRVHERRHGPGAGGR